MSAEIPTLHMMCGKIASGKSTLAASLSASHQLIVIAEDEWLKALYSDQMKTIADYVQCMSKLRAVIGPHVADLLNSGLSLVLDFQANTVQSRTWMKGILEQTKAEHALHVLDTPDHVCISRLHARNAKGDHPFAATEEQFHQVSKHHVAPTPDEGFNIVLHRIDSKQYL